MAAPRLSRPALFIDQLLLSPGMAAFVGPPSASKLAACRAWPRCVDARAATHLRRCACACVRVCANCCFISEHVSELRMNSHVSEDKAGLLEHKLPLICILSHTPAHYLTHETHAFPLTCTHPTTSAKLCSIFISLVIQSLPLTVQTKKQKKRCKQNRTRAFPLTCTHPTTAAPLQNVLAATLPQADADQAATHA